MKQQTENRRFAAAFEALEQRMLMSASPLANDWTHLDRTVAIDHGQAVMVSLRGTNQALEPHSHVTASPLNHSASQKAFAPKAHGPVGKPATKTVGQTLANHETQAPNSNPLSDGAFGGKKHHKPKPAHHHKPPKHKRPAQQNSQVFYPGPIASDTQAPPIVAAPAVDQDYPLLPVVAAGQPTTYADTAVEPAVEAGAAGWVDESGNPLFGPAGPSPDDIVQGSAADCYFLATLSATARQDPSLIEQDVMANGNGGFQVQFQDQGQPVVENVDGLLPVDANGNLVYAQLGQGGDIWVPIMEKAFALFRSAQRGLTPDYANIDWGTAPEVLSDLGTANIADYDAASLPDGASLAAAVSQELSNGRAVTYATVPDPNAGPLVSNHVYSVVAVGTYSDGTYAIEVRNPYGNDGPNADGYNWVDAATALGQMSDVSSAFV